MKTCYLSGPMRGYKEFNFPAFDAAEVEMRAQGWEVISPAQMDRAAEAIGPDEKEWEFGSEQMDAAIDRDFAALRALDPETDAIVMLPGWERSVGATAELAIARWRGLRIIFAPGAGPGRVLPTGAQARKDLPICTGVLDYFPDALIEVARVSLEGNKQHNPGQPLHWAKEKSTDHADALMRHLVERGKPDSDGMRHSGKVAWRALALLQIEIEKERGTNG